MGPGTRDPGPGPVIDFTDKSLRVKPIVFSGVVYMCFIEIIQWIQVNISDKDGPLSSNFIIVFNEFNNDITLLELVCAFMSVSVVLYLCDRVSLCLLIPWIMCVLCYRRKIEENQNIAGIIYVRRGWLLEIKFTHTQTNTDTKGHTEPHIDTHTERHTYRDSISHSLIHSHTDTHSISLTRSGTQPF